MNNRLTASTAAALLFACCTLGAQQADRARTEALSQRAADRLQALHDEADRLASDERTLLGELRRLEVERQIKAEELRQADTSASAAAGQLRAVDLQIQQLEQQEQAEKPELHARLVNLYKLGRGRYGRLLLSTSDVRRVAQAARMVAALAQRDRERVARHERRLQELTTSRKALDDRRRQLASLRAGAERAKSSADRAIIARNQLIQQIDQQRDLNAQLAGELQGAQQKLQATLAAVAGSTASDMVSLPLRPFRGALEWPAVGTIRQRFGRATTGRSGFTNGIDIAAPEGTGVRAVHDGVVAFADAFTGFGKLVIVDHGVQTFSLYGNLADVAVARGAHVQHGESVGTVGTAPTGAAGLYFELRVDGRPVDPLEWLRRK
jgi:septal ring factor EnvC (AmiA/AmiB activator)